MAILSKSTSMERVWKTASKTAHILPLAEIAIYSLPRPYRTGSSRHSPPFSCIPQYPIIVLLLSLFPGSFFGCSGSRNRPFIRFYALSASKPFFSYLVRIILFPRASFVFKQGIYISKRIFTQIKNLMINIHRL